MATTAISRFGIRSNRTIVDQIDRNRASGQDRGGNQRQRRQETKGPARGRPQVVRHIDAEIRRLSRSEPVVQADSNKVGLELDVGIDEAISRAASRRTEIGKE